MKGKQGKVLNVFPKTGKVIVEGVAFVTKHQKARRQGQQGGIFQKERAIDASNVMLICPKCGKADPRGSPQGRDHPRGWHQEDQDRPRLQALQSGY